MPQGGSGDQEDTERSRGKNQQIMPCCFCTFYWILCNLNETEKHSLQRAIASKIWKKKNLRPKRGCNWEITVCCLRWRTKELLPILPVSTSLQIYQRPKSGRTPAPAATFIFQQLNWAAFMHDCKHTSYFEVESRRRIFVSLGMFEEIKMWTVRTIYLWF